GAERRQSFGELPLVQQRHTEALVCPGVRGHKCDDYAEGGRGFRVIASIHQLASKIEMHRVAVRVEPDGMTVTRNRSIRVALVAQNKPALEMGRGVCRVKRNRSVKGSDGSVQV